MILRYAVKEVRTGYVELDVPPGMGAKLLSAVAAREFDKGNMVEEDYHVTIADRPMEKEEWM